MYKKQKTQEQSFARGSHDRDHGGLDTAVVSAEAMFDHHLTEKPLGEHPGFRKSPDVHPVRLHHDTIAGVPFFKKASITMRDPVQHLPSLVVEDYGRVAAVNGRAILTDVENKKTELSRTSNGIWVDQRLRVMHENRLELGKGH